MRVLGLGRETLLDAAVNAFPLAILAVFMALFLLVDPWPPTLSSLLLGQALLALPLVVLLVATGVVARLFEG